MKTYPHQEGDGIIELVRKDEHDAVVHELNERLTKQQADMLDTSVQLRTELTRWQSLAEKWATALKDIDNLRNDDFPSGDFSDTAIVAFVKASDALAAYESAAKEEQP